VAEIKQGEIEITPVPIALVPAGMHVAGLPVTQPQRASEPASKPASKIALLLNSFDMNGVGPDKIYLVQGFRHHLIACLVRFREWIVADNVAQISPSANAPTISSFYSIDATAYQIKDVANVVLTLRDNGSGRYVWSENFELNLENWFESQQRIVRRIAISLNVQLPTERLMRLAGEPDISLASYDRWLRGQDLIIGFSPDNWDRATQLFEDTIREAPTFSPAYSSLVQMNNAVHFVHPGILRDEENERKTLDLARSAVQLDPVDSRAQLCLGWAYAMSKQYVQAEIHMDLARELNENDSWTLTSAALFNAFCGRIAHAQSLARQSLETSLAPTPTQWAYHAMVRFICGDYDGVIAATDHAKDVIKTMPGWRAAALFHLGRGDEAREDGQRCLALIRSRWFGSAPATDEAIGRWLLHCHPISSPENWERLRAGLQHAGIPSGDMRHHEW
jgi:TolB-like protein